MKLEDQVKQKLIEKPEYRERRKKVEFMARWLHHKYPYLLGDIQKLKTIEDMVDELISIETYWRKILRENPELRGSDYGTKDIVVQKKKIELGYTPHFYTDIKMDEKL